MSLSPQLSDFDPDRDRLTVTVTWMNADGSTDATMPPFRRTVPMVGGSVKATANAIWGEAGSPRYCTVDVEISRQVGRFLAEGGDLESLNF